MGVREAYDARGLAVATITGAFWVGIPTALVVWALQYISGGLGAILQSTVPFFIAFFAHVYLGQSQLKLSKIGGMIIGFLGIIVLFSDDPIEAEHASAYLAGAAVILSAVSIGFAQSFSRKHFRGTNHIIYNVYLQLFGGMVILPFAFVGGLPRLEFTTEFALTLLYLAVIATAIPFTLYFSLYQRVDFVLLSMMAYVIPVVAVVGGIVWLGERLTTVDLAGSVLVLLGVLLATQIDLLRSKLHVRSLSKG